MSKKIKKNKKRKVTNAMSMFNETNRYFEKYKNNVTRKAYISNFRRFLRYCSSEMKCKKLADCREHIQSYEKALEKQGYSASTIHTYIAPVCKYFNVKMDEIEKPLRYTSEYTRGRSSSVTTKRADSEADNPKYARSSKFQRAAGIRRSELKRLTGADFVPDESGYPCVRVKRGKGGKMQLQRILPENVGLVKSYFDGVEPDERIFTAAELNNSVNYHAMRAENARKMYAYYAEEIKNGGEAYRTKLENELRERCKKYHIDKKTSRPVEFDERLARGQYKLRGKNREFAAAHSLTLEYDRLAVMAVSVFGLSHWRLDVTVVSYLLAI